MAKKQKRKGFFRNMVDFQTWMGFDDIKATGAKIGETFESIKNVSFTDRVETFEQAVARMNLDETSINKRRRQCFYSAWAYVALTLGLLGYAFSLLLHDHILSFFITLIFAAIAGLCAYREGFWYFQMTVKKLGCSHQEFLMYLTGRK